MDDPTIPEPQVPYGVIELWGASSDQADVILDELMVLAISLTEGKGIDVSIAGCLSDRRVAVS